MENELEDLEFLAALIEMKPIKRFFVGLFLFLFSLVLKYTAFLLGLIIRPIYYFITLKWKTGLDRLGVWFYKVALVNGQTANAQSAAIFRLFLIKANKKPAQFGNPDDSLDYVLARNRYKGVLNALGRSIGRFYEFIDSSKGGHLYKRIIDKILADQEAINRIHDNKYFK